MHNSFLDSSIGSVDKSPSPQGKERVRGISMGFDQPSKLGSSSLEIRPNTVEGDMPTMGSVERSSTIVYDQRGSVVTAKPGRRMLNSINVRSSLNNNYY